MAFRNVTIPRATPQQPSGTGPNVFSPLEPATGLKSQPRFLPEYLDALKDLRRRLDAREITVDEFVKTGQPLAQKAYEMGFDISGRGSDAANSVKGYGDTIAGIGFSNSPTDKKAINLTPDLPAGFEEDVRRSLLPPGLSPEQQNAYLKDIPLDIKYGSDQYNIEKEGLRQKLQSEGVAAKQKSERMSQLTDLAGILSSRADTNFQRSIPTIAENANTAGIYRSTGYGNALANQQGQLQQDVTSQLAQQGLQDRALDTGAIGDILAAQQGYQSSGLQRQFSLEDFAKNAQYARSLAEASRPQTPGKTSGEKWAQGINAGANVGQVATSGKTGGRR